MSRISRKTFHSGFFHIMIQGINKEYIFKEKDNKEKYMYLMKKYHLNYQLKIIAYCIMNNHAHFIIYSEDVNQISQYMHKINSIYAMDYNKCHNRVGYLFRDRYKSQYIYDREYLLKCIKYIHMNPVKAGLVKKESEYIYSSYRDFKEKQGYIDNEIIKLVFENNERYLQIFNNMEEVDVEIMDVDNNKDNFEIAIKNYLIKNNLKLDKIKNNTITLYNFVVSMQKKGYKQKQIAEKLGVYPNKISNILKKREM